MSTWLTGGDVDPDLWVKVVLPRVLHYKFLLFLSILTLDVKPDPSLHSSRMFCLLFILKTLQTSRKVNKNSVINSHISSSSFSPRASSIHALSVSLTSSTNLVLILFVLLLFWLNRFRVSCRQLCSKYSTCISKEQGVLSQPHYSDQFQEILHKYNTIIKYHVFQHFCFCLWWRIWY